MIVDDGRELYEVRLMERLAGEPECVYVVADSLHFIEEEPNRQV